MQNKKMSKKNQKNFKKGVIIAAASLGLIGGAFAYFSAQSDVVRNKFDVATGENDKLGDIRVVEPSWSEPNEVLKPGELLAKDPSVVNNANYDGYAIIRVKIPKVQSVMGATGNYYEGLNEIARMRYYGVDQVALTNGTALVPELVKNRSVQGSEVGDRAKGTYNSGDFVYLGSYAGDEEYNSYYFGYINPIAPGERTTNLFDYIQINDFNELYDGDNASINNIIDIDARMVQRIDVETGFDYGDVETAFNNAYGANAGPEDFGCIGEPLVTTQQEI